MAHVYFRCKYLFINPKLAAAWMSANSDTTAVDVDKSVAVWA